MTELLFYVLVPAVFGFMGGVLGWLVQERLK